MDTLKGKQHLSSTTNDTTLPITKKNKNPFDIEEYDDVDEEEVKMFKEENPNYRSIAVADLEEVDTNEIPYGESLKERENIDCSAFVANSFLILFVMHFAVIIMLCFNYIGEYNTFIRTSTWIPIVSTIIYFSFMLLFCFLRKYFNSLSYVFLTIYCLLIFFIASYVNSLFLEKKIVLTYFFQLSAVLGYLTIYTGFFNRQRIINPLWNSLVVTAIIVLICGFMLISVKFTSTELPLFVVISLIALMLSFYYLFSGIFVILVRSEQFHYKDYSFYVICLFADISSVCNFCYNIINCTFTQSSSEKSDTNKLLV